MCPFGHAKSSEDPPAIAPLFATLLQEGPQAADIPETHHSPTKVGHPMLDMPLLKTLQGTTRYQPVWGVPKDGSEPNQQQADRAKPPSASEVQGEATPSEQPIKREPLPSSRHHLSQQRQRSGPPR